MNNSNVTSPEDLGRLPERIVEAVLLTLVIVVAITGNVSIWIIVLKSKVLRTVTNMFILGLSAADLLVSTVNMPVTVVTLCLGYWPLSDTACVGFGFTNMLTLVTSVLSLCNISINRYIMVCRPASVTRIYTNRRALMMIAAVVILSAVLSTLPLYGWGEYTYIPRQSFCFSDWPGHVTYAAFMIGCGFGVPFVVMTACNVFIIRAVGQRSSNVHTGKMTENSRRSLMVHAHHSILKKGVMTTTDNLDCSDISDKETGHVKQGRGRKSETHEENSNVTAWSGQCNSRTDNDVTAWSGQCNSRTDNDVTSCPGKCNGCTDNDIISCSSQWNSSTGNDVTAWSGQCNSFTDNDVTAWSGQCNSFTGNDVTAWSGQCNSFTDNDVTAWSGQCNSRTGSDVTACSGQCNSNATKQQQSRKSRHLRRADEIRLAKSLIIVVLCFILLWLPYCICIVLSIISAGNIPRWFQMFSILLGYANSGVNPIIYGVMNRRFATGFRDLFCCCRKYL